MNRPYVHRGQAVPGVYQRCRVGCPKSGCKVSHAWWYLVDIPPEPGGGRRQVTKGGFPSGADAAAARQEILRKNREGTLPRDGKLTVETWLRTWLTAQDEVRGLRDGTLIDYRRHIESYWIPLLGHLKLSELRSRHVTEALARIRRERERAIRAAVAVNAAAVAAVEPENARRRAKGFRRMVKPTLVTVPRPFGPSTAQRVHATLRAALNAAVRAEEVARNVALYAERPRVNRRKVKPVLHGPPSPSNAQLKRSSTDYAMALVTRRSVKRRGRKGDRQRPRSSHGAVGNVSCAVWPGTT